jgi:hypothetical protein
VKTEGEEEKEEEEERRSVEEEEGSVLVEGLAHEGEQTGTSTKREYST